ncbi:MAG: hypothetical protein ACXWUG_29455 [Polyangiales bacterium]
MMKTLATCALLAGLAMGSVGCAAASADEGGQQEAIQQTHEALSLKPKGLYPLSAEATALPDGRTIIDVALTPIPSPVQESDEIPLHASGDFQVVLVYIDHADGTRDAINAFAGAALNQSGPGGGCIHVFVNAKAGDHLFIGGAVKLTGQTRTQIAAAPITTVQPGQWPFNDLPDHNLPAP